MFKYLYNFYSNLIDTPSTQFKLNLWVFSNIRVYKIKLLNSIVFFISNLLSLQKKYIKIFHKVFNFDSFTYIYILLYFFLAMIMLFFL